MFIDVTLENNDKLIEAAVKLHRAGFIQPDTYVLDLDAIINNAVIMKTKADQLAIDLFFMTKQMGRNPLVARKLQAAGLAGAVAVDFREAQLLAKNGVKIAHVGHLVQLPSVIMPKLLALSPEYVTVFSLEKAREISYCAKQMGIIQKLLLRVIDDNDILYSGQYGGFMSDTLEDAADELKKFDNIEVSGVTAFPCFLYDENRHTIEATHNLTTLIEAKQKLQNRGLNAGIINAPSATCTASLPQIAAAGASQAEPGHGLTGTTPLHVSGSEPEMPAVVYVSEISHTSKGKIHCFGGGYYRRSHVQKALVFNGEKSTCVRVVPPNDESIDYYWELDGEGQVGQTVVMAFRTQIFVTRSEVAVVSGIQEDRPKVEGIFSSLGGVV